ncbi:MAG: hypothetical protein JNM26_05370 [Ideonella sp.]|nr:hypothetical protein [Ideonella sp.]
MTHRPGPLGPITAAALALCGLAAPPALAHGGNLTVQFAQCTEFVGVAPVDALKARALVPARYALVSDAAGARLVVRAADCASVRVGSLPARPGRVAQVGLIIVSPDGTATDPNTSINNYTLSYASNSPALVAALRAAGVPAALDLGLAYEVNPATGNGSEFYAAVSPEFDASPTWFLHGSVNTPTFATSFLANWWRADGARETKMATDIPAIGFDFASQVNFTTSRLNTLGKLIGSNRAPPFVLSFRGAFAAGTMVVTVDR